MSSTIGKLLRKRSPAERLAFMRGIAAGRAGRAQHYSRLVEQAKTPMELAVIEAAIEQAGIEAADAKRLKAAIRGKAKKVKE